MCGVIRINHTKRYHIGAILMRYAGEGREWSARIYVSAATWRNASVSSDPSGAADAPGSTPGPLLLGPPVRSMTVDWIRPGSVYQVQCVG
jgi:hypothetical protein